jgi:SAM-dependent methyltransferase
VPRDYFDEPVAATYDADEAEMFAAAVLDRTVDVLASLADGGPVLELGIGTGRVALPLAARGLEIHGIELSAAMLRRLAGKPGGAGIPVTVGDFATARAPGSFRLAYLVFNTIMNLTTQDEQVACFANVARHLAAGGRFVVEVSVPDLQRLPFGETVRPFTVTPEHLGFDEYDLPRQGLVSHHYRFGAGESRQVSVPFRYVWPAELDLMARLAGLQLRERWADWDRSPFTATSTKHVSVWQKA